MFLSSLFVSSYANGEGEVKANRTDVSDRYCCAFNKTEKSWKSRHQNGKNGFNDIWGVMDS